MDLLGWSLTNVKQRITREFILLVLVLLLLIFVIPLIVAGLSYAELTELENKYESMTNSYLVDYAGVDWQEALNREIEREFVGVVSGRGYTWQDLESYNEETQVHSDAAQGTGGTGSSGCGG
jgi:hypothetical protein